MEIEIESASKEILIEWVRFLFFDSRMSNFFKLLLPILIFYARFSSISRCYIWNWMSFFYSQSSDSLKTICKNRTACSCNYSMCTHTQIYHHHHYKFPAFQKGNNDWWANYLILSWTLICAIPIETCTQWIRNLCTQICIGGAFYLSICTNKKKTIKQQLWKHEWTYVHVRWCRCVCMTPEKNSRIRIYISWFVYIKHECRHHHRCRCSRLLRCCVISSQ